MRWELTLSMSIRVADLLWIFPFHPQSGLMTGKGRFREVNNPTKVRRANRVAGPGAPFRPVCLSAGLLALLHDTVMEKMQQEGK